MSYIDEKRARDLALIRSTHGAVAGDDEPRPTSSPSFDGGARSVPESVTAAQRRYELRRLGVERIPSDEPGWQAFEIEDGAALLFPWLEDD